MSTKIRWTPWSVAHRRGARWDGQTLTDKTQIATVALAAHYANLMAVVAGTRLGMLIADVPAVFIGNRVAGKLPMRLVHGVAAAIFAVLGLVTLLNPGRWF